jgi:hypothetical protein
LNARWRVAAGLRPAHLIRRKSSYKVSPIVPWYNSYFRGKSEDIELQRGQKIKRKKDAKGQSAPSPRTRRSTSAPGMAAGDPCRKVMPLAQAELRPLDHAPAPPLSYGQLLKLFGGTSPRRSTYHFYDKAGNIYFAFTVHLPSCSSPATHLPPACPPRGPHRASPLQALVWSNLYLRFAKKVSRRTAHRCSWRVRSALLRVLRR